MSDRVLRPRGRTGPSSYSLSADREKATYSAGRRRHKEATLVHTVAQDRFKHQQAASKKRVVFSTKRFTSDDLANGRAHGAPEVRLADVATPVIGILKHTPSPPQYIDDYADLVDGILDKDLADDGDLFDMSTPKAPPPGRKQGRAAKARRGRVSKHSSFTEETRTSPWMSASSSILAALALSVSPLARKRAQQAEKVAEKDESVRRAVHFYKDSGEWWNVFPKTDYSYSPVSSFHREISPGVMTLPNMSRPSLHSPHSFQQELLVNTRQPPLWQNYSDSFESDSDEVDEGIKISAMYQQQSPNILMRVSYVVWTTVLSILGIISSVMQSIIERGFSLISTKRKPIHVSRHQRFYNYRPHQESVLSRLWSQIQTYSSKSYYENVQWRPVSTSIVKRHSWITPLLFLLPFIFLFLGWWFWNNESVSMTTEKLPNIMKSAVDWIWSVITFPFIVIESLLYQIWDVLCTPLEIMPSFGSLGVILFDVCCAPLLLLQSIVNLLLSYGSTVVSLFQMVLASVFSFKINLMNTSSESALHSNMPNTAENEALKAFLESALRKQEASIMSKLSETEQSFLNKMAVQEAAFHSELAAKDNYHQHVGAKVAYLQDELRRWRRRFAACCRRPESVSTGVMKNKLWDELKNLLSSPEGLVLLGAAVAHTSPVDKTPANVPHFNETEIRAWVTSAFLDKDDFDKALANITKYFNEELDRRSSIMLAASSEEINALIARQDHIHKTQMAKLQSELANTYLYQNEGIQKGTTFSSGNAHEDDKVRRIVDAALAVYDADKTGMADYALESQGGEVVSTRCTETYQVKSPTLSVFGVPLWYPSNSPRTVIQPGMHPGECWAFVGSQGFLVIKLSHRIRVKGFTYEHISPVLLPTGRMDSAPKDFSVHGLRGEGDNNPIILGNYNYLQNSTSMQYFGVQHLVNQPFQLIEIQVKSNHGNINYTCMYRFRIHGSIA